MPLGQAREGLRGIGTAWTFLARLRTLARMVSKSRSPIQVPQDQPSSDNSLAQVFGDPDLVRSTSEDPVLKVVMSWWRQVTVAVLAVLAVFYATNVFRETREKDLQSSGDALHRAQREFEEYRGLLSQLSTLQAKKGAELTEQDQKQLAELEKNRDATRKKLEDGLVALADMRAPFGRVASLYRALLSREAGDTNALTNSINPRGWTQIQDRTSADRLIAELEAMAYARALLDSKTQAAEALSLLKELGASGAYTHTSAALTVAAVAKTAEERAAALELLTEVQRAHPEQSALLEDEIARLR